MIHCTRMISALFLIAAMTLTANAAVESGTVVARFDLQDRGNFEKFKTLQITPFFRIGNVFFAEASGEQLAAVRQAKITYEIIDTEPFSRPYYTGTIEALPSLKIPAPDLERLSEVENWAFYAGLNELDLREYHMCGFEPIRIEKREIPLTYFSTAPAPPNPNIALVDPVLDGIIAAVDQDSIFTWTQRLQDFQTRLALSDSAYAARNWIRQKFLDFGYTNVSLSQFWCPDNRYGASGWDDNVVCIKTGYAEPDKVIVIGGHWDSIVYDGNDPWVFAPGADDDGSGTVATMEIARILAGIPTKKTIHFVAFGSEENGLVGSWDYAIDAVNAGLDIEVMLNMDMIGYTADAVPNVYCNYMNGIRMYADLMTLMGEAYTWLEPVTVVGGGGSDHYPFSQVGYPVAYAEEGDFNWPGWHTELDLTSEMDFPYFTEVVKMVAATSYTVTQFPSAITDGVALDVGDGQSLQVEWTALNDSDIEGYWVYWGTQTADYDDSVYVSGVSSSGTTIAGLINGQEYFFTVVAIDDQNRESFLRPEFAGTPHIVPLPPGNVMAEPAYWQIDLNWDDNQELDFDHYTIYRGSTPGVYAAIEENWTSSEYIDTDVSSGVMYEYVIAAVDADLNESGYSTPVQAAAATFDQGILVLDLTPAVGGNPSAAARQNYFNALLAGFPKGYYAYDPTAGALNKSIIGQYGTVIWYDDGNAASTWKADDLDKLRWYLNYNTGVFLTGWRVAFELAGLASPKTLTAGNILYDYAGVTRFEETQDVDLEGGIGQNGYPNVALDPAKVFSIWEGKMGWIGMLDINNPANEIYKFDSYSGAHTGETIGVARDNGGNKFAFLSMPFYYLQETDARELVLTLLDWFGYDVTCDCAGFGDVNLDDSITPLDVAIMVSYVYKSLDARQQLPSCPGDNGDWNCDGQITPLDVTFVVNYVYKSRGGPCNPCLCLPYPTNCP